MRGGVRRRRNSPRLGVGFTLWSAVLAGCGASMTVAPPIAPPAALDFRLPGRVVYDGNPEYLPRTIVAAPGGAAAVTLQYSYTVTQGRQDVPGLVALFNPLTAIGFPVGQDTLVVGGRLEIRKRDQVVKTYVATAGLESTRNIFWAGDTATELRRRGLLAVRDNIEAQMQHERDVLSQLANDN